ncbi:MAG TPA: YCF48-related protein, partial [Candidatus Limnocylindria bacterium]|nr:YCF48-related protein [Candidatus Limnocylindria bacterium]
GVVGGVAGGLAAQRVGAVAESVRVTAPGEFSSPDGSVAWRVGPAGRLLRSADGGTTWSPQNTGVKIDLLAGSAPSREVCWVVGRAGIVLLSVAGGEWRRIAFPEAVDLVAVSATDAITASVTTVDGRLFATSDGGKIWKMENGKW